MQQHIHTIVKHFFQKDSLQEVSEQALQQFTEEHPYSSVGHWLLAKKLHYVSRERYETQSTRASTWFNNPLWLNWTLEDHAKAPETLIIPSLTKEQPVAAPQEQVKATYEPEVMEAPEPEIVEIPETTETPVAEDIVTEEIIAEEAVVATPEPVEEEETEIFIPGVSEPVSLIEEAPAAVIEEPEPVIEEPVSIIEEVPEPEATPAPKTHEDVPAPVEEAPVVFSIPEPRLEEFKPVLSEAEEPVFEPYHTIDYFASLGIKLRQEDLKDKLGMQLKSFTEWLRSMKRIAPTSIDVNASVFDESIQQSIQEIAGHSVEGKEVLTEAMADVWAKQGNKQKAIAIYDKLSLLNPAKSAYFAAQIDKLKAS